ncbi:MAG: ATP synthase F1 subunit gamma, partial [Candidatus Magasanikbacteria bacterium]|nr:ATP synthase F1 subunit gamma [Candidatus Magasanikbacteria bacterium]
VLVILVTSNRGLCGSFNSNIIKKTSVQLKNPDNLGVQDIEGKILKTDKVNIDVLGIGKKGAEFAKRNNYNLVASFNTFSDTPSLNDILPISQMVINEYSKKNYDKVVVAYTAFKSAISQTAKLKQVLPISPIDLESMIGDAPVEKTLLEEQKAEDRLFEPNPQEVLQTILPRLVETELLQATLESSASEHSARMMAMRSASDAASDMISELNLNFNKARQAAITQEIAEIAGGAAALE